MRCELSVAIMPCCWNGTLNLKQMVGFDPDLEMLYSSFHCTDSLASFTVLLLVEVLAMYVYNILWACNNNLRSSLKTFSENGEPCIWMCLVAGYIIMHTHIGCLRVIIRINMLIQLITTVPISSTNRISCLLLLEQAIWLLAIEILFHRLIKFEVKKNLANLSWLPVLQWLNFCC